MYIASEIKFLPNEWNRPFTSDEKIIIYEFNKLFFGKFDIDLDGKDKISFEYKVKWSKDSLEPLVCFLEKYENSLNICIYAETIYEEEDFNEASAYILKFPKKFQYYDDWNEEQYDSFPIICSEDVNKMISCGCGIRKHTTKIFVKPNMGIKKAFHDKFNGATNHELSDASIVSKKLCEHLLSNGISSKYFKPVYQKNGEIWAFFLDGSQNQIASKQVEFRGQSSLEKCTFCGNPIIKSIESERMVKLKSRLKKSVIIGDLFEPDCWSIKSDAISKLMPINLTEDYFFSTNQITMINKDVYELIKEKVPNVRKYTIPVFSESIRPL